MEVLLRERTHDPRIPPVQLRRLQAPKSREFPVDFFCRHCITVLSVREKDVMRIAGQVLASYEEMYISLEKCMPGCGEDFAGAEFKPIPR